MTITTTLNQIRAKSPCKEGWTKLLSTLGKTAGDDEPLPFSVIVASNGLDDALWCCQCEPDHARVWRLYAVWCARQVQHLMTDPCSIAALDVVERHANGMATDSELAAARAAADAARDAARAAWAAGDAADAAAWGAADAARAARAAGDAADAADAAARSAQIAEFLRVVS